MIYLLSYVPLANSTEGRAVATRNRIPPYVDASCRREPDFELASPFVSGLCRPSFVATLNVGDLLVYMTKMSAVHRSGRRLVAVLELVRAFGSHADAAIWYRANGFRLPHSCIVPGNDPLPIALTNPKMTKGTALFTDSKLWDRAVYAPRAKNCVKCFAATALFLRLDIPPTVTDEFWTQTLGGDPGQRTQSSGLSLERNTFEALMNHAGIHLL
jgi:hypothetical protein